MKKMTYLADEQIFGDKKIDIIKKRGPKADKTDFSKLLRGFDYGDVNSYWTRSLNAPMHYYNSRKNGRWGKRPVEYMMVCEDCGDYLSLGVRATDGLGGRPVLPLGLFSKIPTNGIKEQEASDGVIEVEFGYYPQQAASVIMQKN